MKEKMKELKYELAISKRDERKLKKLRKLARVIKKRYNLKCCTYLYKDKVKGEIRDYLDRGYYIHRGYSRKGFIFIYNKQSFNNLVVVLIHELAHAYEYQVMRVPTSKRYGYHGERFWFIMRRLADVLIEKNMIAIREKIKEGENRLIVKRIS